LRLWVESAHRSLTRTGEEVCADVVRTARTEDMFFAVLVGGPRGGAEGRKEATLIADKAVSMLARGMSLDTVVGTMLSLLPRGEHVPFSILQVLGGCEAYVAECDAPPLFLTRSGQLALPPVLEEVSHGRLIRRCQTLLRDGDHIVIVSEGYLRCSGWRWGWPDVAIAVQRWGDTRCDADELLGALVRTYRRLDPEPPQQDVTVGAMYVRPERHATVWTGPPVDPAQDEAALGKLMAERDIRIVCGDTTAEIAARLLGARLEMEPRPEDTADSEHPWAEVPPTSRLEGMDLVTEGLVTLGKARERMAGAERPRDLPRQRDGATRLARALLAADKIHFVVGMAANPQQVDESGVPLRRSAVEGLVRDLEAHGKIVSVEYL
jgi:hypothetical protein